MYVLKLLLKIGGWFLVVSSIIFLLVSLFAYLHARNFARSATRAQGTVIRLEKRDSRDLSTVYHPVITFRDTQGAQHELFSSVGSFPPSHKVGDAVTVLYPAEHPQKAKLDAFFDVWGLAVITAGIGSFDLLLGLAMLLVPVFIRRFMRAPSPIPSAAVNNALQLTRGLTGGLAFLLRSAYTACVPLFGQKAGKKGRTIYPDGS